MRELRALPASFDVRVGGGAAEFVDQQAAIGSRLLLAIALLVGLTLVVLWLMTGSVVLPVKAVLMNALTVGAALAPLTLIYQGGHLTGLLGYTPNGGVEPSDFLVTAAIVFALSTDYGVFLLGRIKEERDARRRRARGGRPRASPAPGRVVTAAAILLAVAIGVFSTSSISFIQQIGVATATGVLIDAFVVRTLLVPSLMALLGRWNWWSPRPLRRLHGRIGLREVAPARYGREHVRRARTASPATRRSSPGRRSCSCRRCWSSTRALSSNDDKPGVTALGVVAAFVGCLPLVLRARLGFFALAPLLTAGRRCSCSSRSSRATRSC